LWGRAGLYNLFASFKVVGEPASTDPTGMVPDLSSIALKKPSIELIKTHGKWETQWLQPARGKRPERFQPP
jgi:hypothetical protein